MVIDESENHFMYIYKWNEGRDGSLIAKSPVSIVLFTSSMTVCSLQENFFYIFLTKATSHNFQASLLCLKSKLKYFPPGFIPGNLIVS